MKKNPRALLLSALVHIALLAALFLGVQWKTEKNTAFTVDLWNPKALEFTKPAQKPVPEPKAQPQPIQAPQQQEPIIAKPAELPKKTLPDPEIRLKEERRIANEKRLAEERRKAEEAKKRKEEEKRKAQEKRIAEEKRKEEETKKRKEEKRINEEKEKRKEEVLAVRRAHLKGLLDAAGSESKMRSLQNAQYIEKIRLKIKGNVTLPPNISGNPLSIFEVSQLPTGEVVNVRLVQTSGIKTLDSAVQRAIYKSSPLPQPEDASLYERILTIEYRPLD